MFSERPGVDPQQEAILKMALQEVDASSPIKHKDQEIAKLLHEREKLVAVDQAFKKILSELIHGTVAEDITLTDENLAAMLSLDFDGPNAAKNSLGQVFTGISVKNIWSNQRTQNGYRELSGELVKEVSFGSQIYFIKEVISQWGDRKLVISTTLPPVPSDAYIYSK